MRLIRLMLISVVLLFVLASLVGVLLPSTVLVSRAIDIAAPKDSVKQYIADIAQWKNWIDGMGNATVNIHSSKKADIGTTHIGIIQLTDSTIVSDWTGAKGSHQLSTLRLIGDTAQNITVAQWQFEQHLGWYPWERFGSMMNDKILGTMMEKNLNNLKTLAEKR